MDRSLSLTTTGILYIPPFYENDFALALDRFSFKEDKIEYRVFTLEKRVLQRDLNRLLNMCRTIISEEQEIQMLFTDSLIVHLIIGKLLQEFPRIRSGGANFTSTLQWIDRSLINQIINDELCIRTLTLPSNEHPGHHQWKEIEQFLHSEPSDGYVKPVFPTDFQSSSFRFSSANVFDERIRIYQDLFDEQYNTCLQSLLRIYLSSTIRSRYLVQPFFDLVQSPHWRLAIANACIYEKEPIVWPLVDGYSGW